MTKYPKFIHKYLCYSNSTGNAKAKFLYAIVQHDYSADRCSGINVKFHMSVISISSLIEIILLKSQSSPYLKAL